MATEDFSIIHISDLHKGPDCDYVHLLDSLKNDRETYEAEGIPPVRFIAVSGDLIQGSDSENPADADAEIKRQYLDVESFLDGLVGEFLGGDRSRMIIVPGNHDVNRCASVQSMVPVGAAKVNDARKAILAGSLVKKGFRWDWEELRFMEIADDVMYRSRFDRFAEFHDRFYAGVSRTFPIQREEVAVLLRFDEYNVAFACFNSCCGLDHLNGTGAVSLDAITSIRDELWKAHEDGLLVIGVWHHHIYGYASSSDYLDRHVLDSMRVNHIKIGLFGHQHKCEILEELKDLTDGRPDDKMLLVGTGTLFGSGKEMLAGTKRQYNILSLKITDGEADLSVRIREDKTGDRPYPIWEAKVFQNRETVVGYQIRLEKGGLAKKAVDIDMEAKKTHDYKKAYVQMKRLSGFKPAEKMADLYIQAVAEEDLNFVLENVRSPESAVEFACLLMALLSRGDRKAVEELITNSEYAGSDNQFVRNVVEEARKITHKKPWER